MRESDVFVFPSIEEGSALVTYEAQACGCVLVISEATGARCRDGVDGYVHVPGDVAMLTEQLRRLHRDPELLARFRAATLARTDDLTWEAAAQELVRIYNARAGSAATSVP
jgi:glycosyltransferase involved in cell wall biosynthesis